MELMSSVLLFALTLLPQTLGKTNDKLTYNVVRNETMIDKWNSDTIILQNEKTILSSIGKVSDLQAVFMDTTCKKCQTCMERAIKAHKIHNYSIKIQSDEEFPHNAPIENNRYKRRIENDTTIKKSKSKRNKSITVFKYVDHGKLYALKVKESSVQANDKNVTKVDSCEVFSVQKYFPCDSLEANTILKAAKNVKNKKSKMEQKKIEMTTPGTKATAFAPLFKKRQLDDSQIPEHYMPSIEELY